MKSIKCNGFLHLLFEKGCHTFTAYYNRTLHQDLTVNMCYCTTLRICNVPIAYNNLYKILINKTYKDHLWNYFNIILYDIA